MADSYTTQADPSATQTFASYGVTSFTVQYWDGSAWQTVSGGSVTGNNLVWKKLSFTAVTTNKIRVVANAAVDSVARIVEVEAWGTAAVAPMNVASTTNGATATAQNYTADSVYPGSHFQPSYATDGVRYSTTIGDHYWRDEHGLSSWLQIDFSGSKTINEIDVYTMADNYATQADPSSTLTFANYGVTSFTAQYWDGSAWQTVPGGNVTSNNLVWKKLSFASITTTKIRVVANAAVDSVARIVEVEAWTPATSAPGVNLNWLVTDQLGTPRMVFDQSGSLATVKRHDYAPFGEELANGARPTTGGYSATDGVRQKFTQKERDNETGLDYFNARYYSSPQGRFTSADSVSGFANNPQTLNAYAYVQGNPLNFTDPTGHYAVPGSDGCPPGAPLCQKQQDQNKDDKQPEKKTETVTEAVGRALKTYWDATTDWVRWEKETPKEEEEDPSPMPSAKTITLGEVKGIIAGSKAEAEALKFLDPTGATGVFDSYVKNDKVGVGISAFSMLSAGRITGFTKHGINQAISRDGVGVATRAIADAVNNPVAVEKGTKGALKYIGRDATVVLSKAGKVITTWARNKAGWRLK